jgi:hypothetical protein
MLISNLLVLACAAMLVLTALVHSVLGEQRLIGPLLAQRDGILQSDLARFLLRAVWHFMSVTFAIIAVSLLASTSLWISAKAALLGATALGIGGAGLYAAVGSRGRHIGWPMLVLIGILAALALIVHP